MYALAVDYCKIMMVNLGVEFTIMSANCGLYLSKSNASSNVRSSVIIFNVPAVFEVPSYPVKITVYSIILLYVVSYHLPVSLYPKISVRY
jgi:hypothetical protein